MLHIRALAVLHDVVAILEELLDVLLVLFFGILDGLLNLLLLLLRDLFVAFLHGLRSLRHGEFLFAKSICKLLTKQFVEHHVL